MSIDYIVKLIDEEESMSETINTDSPNFEGSADQHCFKMHQENIMKLKRCFIEYTTMRTALRQIKDTAFISGIKFNKIANIAETALNNTNKV